MLPHLQTLRDVLASANPAVSANDALPSVESHFQRRLLAALGEAGQLRSADLAALLRDVLRGETESQGADPSTVSLDLGQWPGWPETGSWGPSGLQVTELPAGGHRVRARPWRPAWLPLAQGRSPESGVYAGVSRRCMDAVEGDPFLELVQLSYYLCEGQRDAVRAALTAPPGATLLVDLPTGSGKSLVPKILARLPFLSGDQNGLVVVVVPTTALALDQERGFSDSVPPPTAYYSGSGEAHLERSREIWRRIGEGTQHVVFTSPESFTGSLSRILFEVAQRGGLRAIVIDEAHLIADWGDEFRSSFQRIAGLRRALLRVASRPFRTVLLSATLTETTVETLETLFGGEGAFGVVSAAQLRAEPEYWSAHCVSVEEQEGRIEEAIRHLPRPLILYTTRVADADGWGARLRDRGYGRLRVMTGNTAASDRTRIIQEWAARQVDIVVATSAFGLGIDQSEVRTVIHACVPETLDRYYQEVGRGGRDGRACISLVLYTDKDVRRARRMNRKTIISVELGLQRWRRLWHSKEPVQEDRSRYRVPLEVSPGLSQRYIDMRNRLSTEWHVRTLTLMARAGLIELDAEFPAANDPEKLQVAGVPEPLFAVIRVICQEHLEERTWQQRVEPIRHRTSFSHRRGLDLLEELLKGGRCAGEILADAYTVPARQETGRPAVMPAVNCGGCQWCRARGRTLPAIPPAPSRIPWPANSSVTPELEELLVGSRVLPLTYEVRQRESRRIERFAALLRWMLTHGVRNVVAPQEVMQALLDYDPQLRESASFFAAEEAASPAALLRLPRLPTIFVLLPGRLLDQTPRWIGWSGRNTAGNPPLILVLPEDAVDPRRADRELAGMFERAPYPLSVLEARVGL